MTEDLIDVRCPDCDHHFETDQAGEVECPCCDWEFVCAADGTIEDDGEPDRDPLFEVNAEGEPDPEGLLTVTCTACSSVFQVGEPGVVPCPHCRRTLDVDSWGKVADGTALFLTCPACKTITQQARATHQGTCPTCGCWFEWWDEEDLWDEYWSELEFGPDGCPNCGRREESDYEASTLFARCEDGRARCLACDWVFDPSNLRYRPRDPDDADWYPDIEEEQVAPGLRPRDRAPNAGGLVVAADGSGDCTHIQDAINRARHGARILVRPGNYQERLVLTEPVEIAGDGPAGSVRVTSADGPCLLVGVDRAEVRGLNFAGESGSCAAVEVESGRVLLEDCSIRSGGPACLLVRAPCALPVLRRCRVHQGGQVGVLVTDRALATLEECVISGHAAAGVEILTGGRLRLERCQVIDNRAEGVSVRQDGEAFLNASVLGNNDAANLAIEGGHVRLERCEVCEGGSVGILVRGATAVLEQCLVRGNARSGVSVRPSGKVVLRHCNIRGGRRDGVRVAGRTLALLDDCDLADNARAGLAVRGQGGLRLCRCRFTGNGSAAVSLPAEATVDLAGWDVNGPGRSRWDIEPGGLIRLALPGG